MVIRRRLTRGLLAAVAVVMAAAFALAPRSPASTPHSVWPAPRIIRLLGGSCCVHIADVQTSVGTTGRLLVTALGVGRDGEGIQAVLGTPGGRLSRPEWIARDAVIGGYNPTVVSSTVDGNGRAMILWKAYGSDVMLSVAEPGHGFGSPVAIAHTARASMWDLTSSPNGPVDVDWATDGRLRLGTVDDRGQVSHVHTIVTGPVGNQLLAVDDAGDLAVLWGREPLGTLTTLLICPATGACHSRPSPVPTQFGALAVLPDGTVLAAGQANRSNSEQIAVTACKQATCSVPQVLAERGVFPDFAVDGAGATTLAWEDDEGTDGYLSSSVLAPAATAFSAVTKVRVRTGGVLAALATNAQGDVVAAFQPDDPPQDRSPAMIASYATPAGRLDSFAGIPPGRLRTQGTSDPGVGVEPDGRAVVAWSSATRTATYLDVAMARP